MGDQSLAVSPETPITEQQSDKVSEHIPRQTNKNFALIQEFFREAHEDSRKLEEIPSGATVFFLPEDDPAHARGNLALAAKAVRAGEDVWIYRMGPRWTNNPEQRAIHVDTLELARLGREIAERDEGDDDVESHYGVG